MSYHEVLRPAAQLGSRCSGSEKMGTVLWLLDEASLWVLKGAGSMMEGQNCHPEGPRQVERWAHVNLIKAKCKVLHLGKSKAKDQNRLSDGWMECSTEEKDLGLLVEEKHIIS